MTAVGRYQEGTPMTDDPLRAELIAELCRLHDSVASLDYIDGPDLWADALLPLFAARVAAASAQAWDQGYVGAYCKWAPSPTGFPASVERMRVNARSRADNPYRAGEGTPAGGGE